jgi:hypothetical protein
MLNRSPLSTLTSTFVGALLLVLLSATRASAQSIEVLNPFSLQRLDAKGEPVQKRVLSEMPEGINLQDCLEDQKIRFDLVFRDFEANGRLEAWASLAESDCREVANRVGNMAQCWQVGGPIPLEVLPKLDIPVRELLSGAANGPANPVKDASLCRLLDRTDLRVLFMYFAPGERDTPKASGVVRLTSDMVGPPAPAPVEVRQGDARISVLWQVGEGLQSGGVVYCDANVGTDAGAPTCASAGFKAGAAPPVAQNALHQCGTSLTNEAVVTATANGAPLANGSSYAFAVRARDGFGNLGPLSPVVCATPEAAPADGEGGGCTAFGAGGVTSSSGGGLLFLAALLVSRLRRSRS